MSIKMTRHKKLTLPHKKACLVYCALLSFLFMRGVTPNGFMPADALSIKDSGPLYVYCHGDGGASGLSNLRRSAHHDAGKFESNALSTEPSPSVMPRDLTTSYCGFAALLGVAYLVFAVLLRLVDRVKTQYFTKSLNALYLLNPFLHPSVRAPPFVFLA